MDQLLSICSPVNKNKLPSYSLLHSHHPFCLSYHIFNDLPHFQAYSHQTHPKLYLNMPFRYQNELHQSKLYGDFRIIQIFIFLFRIWVVTYFTKTGSNNRKMGNFGKILRGPGGDKEERRGRWWEWTFVLFLHVWSIE